MACIRLRRAEPDSPEFRDKQLEPDLGTCHDGATARSGRCHLPARFVTQSPMLLHDSSRFRMPRLTDDARFMRNTGMFLLLLSLLAFAPRYFLPLASGTYVAPSRFMHPHAITALLWLVIFTVQPWLIARGQASLHRLVGYFAMLVAVANILSGIAVQLDMLPTGKEDVSNVIGGGFRLFHSLPAFSGFLIAAIVLRRRTDWHFRFMYQTAIAAVATILGRLFVFYGQLPEASAAPLIPLGNLAFVLLLPVYDYVKYRKVHAASWVGLGVFVAFQVVVTPIVFSDLWVSYATGQ